MTAWTWGSVRAFRAARVDSCHHIEIRLSGLNGSIDEGRARAGGYHGGVRSPETPLGTRCTLCVRAWNSHPGKVNAVLGRCHSTSAQGLRCRRIRGVAHERKTGGCAARTLW